MINLYSFFHLNILFSSIEKEQRGEVIQKCYWPLLNLIKDSNLPIAIEAPALTLKIINKYDNTMFGNDVSIYNKYFISNVPKLDYTLFNRVINENSGGFSIVFICRNLQKFIKKLVKFISEIVFKTVSAFRSSFFGFLGGFLSYFGVIFT